MKNRTHRLAVAFLAVAATAAGSRPQVDLPVYLWFGNAAADALTSDGRTVTVNGIVADYADGLENVLAIIQAGGNFRFSTAANARKAVERRLCVDFGTQFADQGMLVPFGDGAARQCVNITEAMHAYPAGDVQIQSLRYGQSVQKLVRFGWIDNGYYFRIGYGSDMNQDGIMDSPPVNVTCIAPADPNVACTRWLLAPQQTLGTAALFRFQVLKQGEGPAEFIGNFSMPFSETFILR